MRLPAPRTAAILAAAVILCLCDASAQNTYSIRQLTAPGLAHGYAWDIDNSGNVVGEMYDSQGQPYAVVWRNGVATALPGLAAGLPGSARAIHDNGTIVGYGDTGTTPASAAAWSSNATGGWAAIDLGFAPGDMFAMALHVSGSGMAVGYSDDALFTRPVAWSDASTPNSLVLLPMPAGASGGAAYVALPNQRAAGYADGPFGVMPLQWSFVGGVPQFTQLPSLSNWGIASAGNSLGVIVGGSVSPVTGRIHIVQWQGGALTDLGTLPGQDCYPEAINDLGDIVGWSRTFSTPPYVAVMKRAGQPIVALQQLLPANTDWTVVRAEAINNRGEIVGVGIRNGFFEPFLMTPVHVGLSAPSPGLSNQTNTWSTSGNTTPGFNFLCASLFGGETIVPGCTQGLDLGNPLVLGVVMPDALGNAAHSLFVPAVVAQIPLYFQAFDWSGCATSNVVPFTFQ